MRPIFALIIACFMIAAAPATNDAPSIEKKICNHMHTHPECHSIGSTTYLAPWAITKYTTLILGYGFAFYFLEASGASIALHEVLGHLCMGGGLLYTYPGPIPAVYRKNYQVDGFDNAMAVQKDGFAGFLRWLSFADGEYPGSGGWAQPAMFSTGRTPLYSRLTESQASAWRSLSGSVPALYLNLMLCALAKPAWENKWRGTSIALFTSAIFLHITASSYPFTAAVMTPEEMKNTSTTGHDFANFAIQMAKYSQGDPSMIADLTAVAYLFIIPAFTMGLLCMHYDNPELLFSADDEKKTLWQRAADNEEVENTVMKTLSHFPKRKQMIEAWEQLEALEDPENPPPSRKMKRRTEKAVLDLLYEANSYLYFRLPQKELNKVRSQLLQNQHPDLVKARWEKAIGAVAPLSLGLMVLIPYLTAASINGNVPADVFAKIFETAFLGLSISHVALAAKKCDLQHWQPYPALAFALANVAIALHFIVQQNKPDAMSQIGSFFGDSDTALYFLFYFLNRGASALTLRAL